MISRILIAAAAIYCVSACAPRGPDIDTILAMNAAARGGAEALEGVRTMRVDLIIVEPEFSVRGAYAATRDGYMRIDIYAGETRVFTEAIGPEGAWQMDADGAVTNVSEAGEAALLRGIAGNLYGLHEMPGLGYKFRLVGPEFRDGTEYWVVESRAPDGSSETLYVDRTSGLVGRTIDTKALHPDVDPSKARFETLRSDYLPTDGILFARKSEKRNLDTAELAQTTTTEEIRLNEVIPLVHFRRPDAG